MARGDYRASTIADCDAIPAADSPRGYYVLALHSGRRCDYICSGNLGWFAVRKATGRVFGYDMAELKVARPVAVRGPAQPSR